MGLKNVQYLDEWFLSLSGSIGVDHLSEGLTGANLSETSN